MKTEHQKVSTFFCPNVQFINDPVGRADQPTCVSMERLASAHVKGVTGHGFRCTKARINQEGPAGPIKRTPG